jgi:hypothetical protein
MTPRSGWTPSSDLDPEGRICGQSPTEGYIDLHPLAAWVCKTTRQADLLTFLCAWVPTFESLTPSAHWIEGHHCAACRFPDGILNCLVAAMGRISEKRDTTPDGSNHVGHNWHTQASVPESRAGETTAMHKPMWSLTPSPLPLVSQVFCPLVAPSATRIMYVLIASSSCSLMRAFRE